MTSKPSTTNCPKLAPYGVFAERASLLVLFSGKITDVPVEFLLLNMSALFEAAIAPGSHLFPFRTEQLSPVAPMVLHTRGRVGRRHFTDWRVSEAGLRKPSFFVSLCRSSGRPSGGGPPAFLALFRLCFSEWGCCPQLRQNCLSCVCFRGSR